jgi:large subunit ribosomal protein L39e
MAGQYTGPSEAFAVSYMSVYAAICDLLVVLDRSNNGEDIFWFIYRLSYQESYCILYIILFKRVKYLSIFMFVLQSAHKTFRIKRKLAKKLKQNRPIPQWVRMRTGNTIR